MDWKSTASVLLLLVGYPLASRYALSSGGQGASLATLAPVAIYCVLFVVFAATLRPGRVPLISRYAQMEQGELSAELHTYTRRLTVIWCGFFVAMAALAIVLAAWAPVQIWFIHTFFVSYLLIGMLLGGEYIYRRWRYPHYRHAGLLTLLRNIRNRGLH